ncbi:MAG: hypothetical protein DRN71_05720 [Candidatus Nanohalarchaeota archaeon]|nr:MAG: hypothetical protein DRN71_05720 [Candidatus Nanohaloarchaeota archaeon]
MSNVKALIRVLTGCDIQCRHCYMSSDSFKNEQFTYSGLETVVDKLTDYGVEVIVFTGGQPTLIGTELIDIIGYTSEKREETGYPAVIEITTNSGIGKNKATANYWLSNFAEAGLDRVRLSVDEYHREFLPEEFEERIIDTAELYNVAIKLMDVAGVEKQIDTNIDTETRKTFALRPGGRAFSDDLA